MNLIDAANFPRQSRLMRKLLILLSLLLPVVLQGATPKMPPERELKTLVTDSLVAFNKAAQQKDFSQFHKQRLAVQLRDGVPLDKFTESFKAFMDKSNDISGIAKYEPVFDGTPAIDSDGVLAVQGHYETKPSQVTFNLKFVNESGTWKILGLDVKAAPGEAKTAPGEAKAAPGKESSAKTPSEQELKEMALDSMLAFNRAIKKGNFEAFYSDISKTWQKQTTAAELAKTFKTFTDQSVNIAGVADVDPQFDETPAINEDGLLVLKGSYPTHPNTVSFVLKYLSE
jgi:hypothetical protein